MTLQELLSGLMGQGQMQPSGPTPNDLIMGALGAPQAQQPVQMPRADSNSVARSPLPPPAMAGAPKANASPAATSGPAALPTPSVPEPGVFDRMGALAEGYGQGGLVGGIANMFTGPERVNDARRQQIQNNNLTYKALLQKGIPEDQAIAIISNPAIAKEVLPKIFAPAEAAKPTDEMREYDLSVSQDRAAGKTPPSFTDWKTGLRKAGAPSTNIDMKQEGAYDKEVGGLLAKEFVGAQTSGATAQRDLGNLAVMKSAMADPNLYTGTGGNAVNSLKRGAQTLFGVDVKGVSSAEVVGNLASEIAVDNKQKLPGPMSDADRNFLVDMAPNLTKSPEGNRLIIELGMASKRWEIARAQLIRDYAAKNGGRIDAGVYAAQAELDNATAAQMGDVIGQLRRIGETAPRAPTVGTPLPQGWSIEKVQ